MGALITLFKRSFQSFGSDKCAAMSAAIAYYTVFSLFPLALLGVSLLGFFVGDQAARDRVIDGITEVIALGPDAEDALSRTLEGTSAAKGWLGIIGLLTAAWSASGLFGAIRSALDSVWDVDRPLPMLRGKLRDLLLLIGFGGLLGASTASTGVLRGARDAGAEWIGPLLDLASPLFNLLTIAAPLALTFAAFMVLYRYAPHARLRWRDIWPAALIATLFFEFGKNLLAYYVLNVVGNNALAGGLGAAILFLVFIYYSAQVILLAAEFAKHRMLVRAGAVPATDPKIAKPKLPLTEKAKGTLLRLWSVDDVHHDADLPYRPSRMDPAGNAPSNTREEVLLKIARAREDALENARRGGVTTNGATGAVHSTVPVTAMAILPRNGVLTGELDKDGDSLRVASGGWTHMLTLSPHTRITRDGEHVERDHLHSGDTLTIHTDPNGEIRRIDAIAKEPQKPAVDWMAIAGFAVTAVATWRRRRAERKRHSPARAKGAHG